ncbi:MAG: hypothetical protein CML68_13565 [Rhodobacteraceae bacterium]|nr:hypothetical protein [Paracoccaceae bacterium]
MNDKQYFTYMIFILTADMMLDTVYDALSGGYPLWAIVSAGCLALWVLTHAILVAKWVRS